MRRILLLATVVVMLAAMLAAAVPAFATIHRLSCSDNKSAPAADGTVADTADPPGITDDAENPDDLNNGTNAPQSKPANTVAANHSDGTGADDENSNGIHRDCVPPGQA